MHNSFIQQFADKILQQGFCLMPGAINTEELELLRARCRQGLVDDDVGRHARSSRGHLYAARNVIEIIPEVLSVWRQGMVRESLCEVLGSEFGLVRVLYFDKPPDRTWALPWHKDMSIAVEDNSRVSAHFTHPTIKAGVPHVIASDDILRRMLPSMVTESPANCGVVLAYRELLQCDCAL